MSERGRSLSLASPPRWAAVWWAAPARVIAGGIHLHKCCNLSLQNIEANKLLSTSQAVESLGGYASSDSVCMTRHASVHLVDPQKCAEILDNSVEN